MQKTLAPSTVIPLCSEGRGEKIIKEREDERGFPSLEQQLLETGEGLLITACEPPTEKKSVSRLQVGYKREGRERWLRRV